MSTLAGRSEVRGGETYLWGQVAMAMSQAWRMSYNRRATSWMIFRPEREVKGEHLESASADAATATGHRLMALQGRLGRLVAGNQALRQR